MRYAIFSDIHGNLEALHAVFKAYKDERIDKFICLGDIVGYGANPNECVTYVRSTDSACVAGNHDCAAVDINRAGAFNNNAYQAILWTAGQLEEKAKIYLKGLKLVYEDKEVICLHGTLDAPGNFDYMFSIEDAVLTFKRMKKSICFVGHTHIPMIFYSLGTKTGIIEQPQVMLSRAAKYICNVGSIGQPRDRHADAAYCVYDAGKKLVEIKRIAYNISQTQEKIIRAGLPEFLANRLEKGR
ncbi:MAG: metallophosphatase family protein [Candidatus Omnitrophica bacterium]|nr:metallophosphatase family protein [Candidatus Omnitrophota bacterium]MBU1925931.1 metallophosphatase family protein [Candidatus Omnitrophota bacterium]